MGIYGFIGNLMVVTELADKDRCLAVVYVRDTYRRTGRGPTGFELHYTKRQCKRKTGPGGLCKQHAKCVR